MTPGRVAITGATGLIGTALCRDLAGAGWQVHALSRRPDAAPRGPSIMPFLCDLPGRIDPASLARCDAVIHAAYATRAADLRRAVAIDEDGTARLLDAARVAGVPRFIFVSSIAAHSGARSHYGQSKLRLESLLDPSRDLALRPGLVLARDAGLFSRLLQTVRTRRLIPLPGGGHQPIQTIDIDDLCAAFRLALELGSTGVLAIAAPQPVTLRELLAMTAQRLGLQRRFVAVPASPMLLALRAAEAMRLPLAATSEGLLGLLGARIVDTRSDLARLGLTLRDTARSLDHLLK